MIQILVVAAILAVFSIPLGIAIARSTQLFVVKVERGRVRFLRGRMPQALLDDIADIVKRSEAEGRVVAVVSHGEPELNFEGEFSDGIRQQMRNVVGGLGVARIRAGSRPT